MSRPLIAWTVLSTSFCFSFLLSFLRILLALCPPLCQLSASPLCILIASSACEHLTLLHPGVTKPSVEHQGWGHVSMNQRGGCAWTRGRGRVSAGESRRARGQTAVSGHLDWTIDSTPRSACRCCVPFFCLFFVPRLCTGKLFYFYFIPPFL